jgi:hypothetical protein
MPPTVIVPIPTPGSPHANSKIFQIASNPTPRPLKYLSTTSWVSFFATATAVSGILSTLHHTGNNTTGQQRDLTSTTCMVQTIENRRSRLTGYATGSDFTRKQVVFPGFNISTVTTENSSPRLRRSWIPLTLRLTKLIYCFTKVTQLHCARKSNGRFLKLA